MKIERLTHTSVAYALTAGTLLSVVSPDSLLNPSLPHINVRSSDMPATMPESVSNEADLLTAINVATPTFTGEGSGVNIALSEQFYTLTAGHVLSANSFNWQPGIYGCKKTTEITTIHDDGGDPKSVSAADTVAAAGHFSLIGQDAQNYLKPDAALLETKPHPDIALAASYIGAKATLNQIAWFENYQSHRRPGYNSAKGEPAEYAGRVIATTKHAAFLLTTLGAHYGAHKDDQLRGGGSGGPVWVEQKTSKGSEVRLLGLSNATLLKPLSALDVQNDFGVYLDGAKPEQQFAINIVGRTTPEELYELATHIKPCK